MRIIIFVLVANIIYGCRRQTEKADYKFSLTDTSAQKQHITLQKTNTSDTIYYPPHYQSDEYFLKYKNKYVKVSVFTDTTKSIFATFTASNGEKYVGAAREFKIKCSTHKETFVISKYDLVCNNDVAIKNIRIFGIPQLNSATTNDSSFILDVILSGAKEGSENFYCKTKAHIW